jgi:hypothetical protein
VSPHPVARTMPQRWTTVFHGSMAEALVLQGLLESNGVGAHILDQNIKVIDPFITGGSAFDVQLQVTEDRAVEAREILDYRPTREHEDGGEPLATPDPIEEHVRNLGVRIRWASILLFTSPYALWLAWPYLQGARSLDRPPPEHGWTIAAIVVSALLLLATVARFVVT